MCRSWGRKGDQRERQRKKEKGKMIVFFRFVFFLSFDLHHFLLPCTSSSCLRSPIVLARVSSRFSSRCAPQQQQFPPRAHSPWRRFETVEALRRWLSALLQCPLLLLGADSSTPPLVLLPLLLSASLPSRGERPRRPRRAPPWLRPRPPLSRCASAFVRAWPSGTPSPSSAWALRCSGGGIPRANQRPP